MVGLNVIALLDILELFVKLHLALTVRLKKQKNIFKFRDISSENRFLPFLVHVKMEQNVGSQLELRYRKLYVNAL